VICPSGDHARGRQCRCIISAQNWNPRALWTFEFGGTVNRSQQFQHIKSNAPRSDSAAAHGTAEFVRSPHALDSSDASIEELPVVVRRILLVEDETMIAMMVEDFLVDLGWEVIVLAGTLDRALAMARDADIDAAILDVNLRGQDSFAAADILSERKIPFVFASGYGVDVIDDRFRGVPTLTKPFQRDELERALGRAMAEKSADGSA